MNQLTLSQYSQTKTYPTDRQRKVIARFWRRMFDLYDTKWTSKHGTAPQDDSVWIDLLCSTPEQLIADGLKTLVQKGIEWPPTVIEFRNICFNNATKFFGVPCFENAWIEALQGTYSHEVVKVAAFKTGLFELERSKADNLQLKKRFNYFYEVILNLFSEGKSLDVVKPALENTSKNFSVSRNDVLIDKVICLHGLNEKDGYAAFLEAKNKIKK